jgi:ferredoxin
MPSNYIPWGGPGPAEKQSARFTDANKKIVKIVPLIKEKKELPVERGPLWQRTLFSVFYAMSFSRVPKMDRSFRVDEKCNNCEICKNVCPADNIAIDGGKPLWNHRCEQCFACLQWCPQQAIQYGKKTPGYERYHHPEVVLKDIIKKR